MRRTEEVMGMPITIDVRDGDRGIDEAFAELRRIDAVFSPFAPDSAVSRIHDGRLRIDDASAEVQDEVRNARPVSSRASSHSVQRTAKGPLPDR